MTSIDTVMLTRQHSLESRGIPRVDYHCHISMTEYSNPANPTIISVSKEEFIADLQEANINKAIVLSDKRTTPSQVADFCRQAPDRFIGFGYVNPILHGSDEDVRMQRNELGLHGLKLYPCSNGFKPDDTHAFKVYEVASELGMPIMFHHAGMPVEYDYLYHTDPAQIDVVAQCFPELKIVLAHLGYPRVDETIYVARKHKNVYCDISWPYGDVNHPSFLYLLWKDLLTALNMGVFHKMIFGTDYPGVRQRFYVDMLMSINRYALNEDLKLPMDRVADMLDKNIHNAGLLP